jgi:SET domain-containing protein
MFLIPTYAAPSTIHGTGCYTQVPIKKGQIIWEFHEGFDTSHSPEAVCDMPESVQEFFRIYAYATGAPRKLVLCGDHARFMNHSEQPNILEHSDGSGRSVAVCDIAPGTELTCDYRSFDADSGVKLF